VVSRTGPSTRLMPDPMRLTRLESVRGWCPRGPATPVRGGATASPRGGAVGEVVVGGAPAGSAPPGALASAARAAAASRAALG
jgi:hypothetical protein